MSVPSQVPSPVPAHRRVVVGVDGSPAADAALVWALDAARRRNVPLHVVHAYLWPLYPPPLVTGAGYTPVGEAGHVQAEKILGAAIAQADLLDPGVPVTGEVIRGPYAGALVQVVGEGADLLVVGNRGRGGFRSLVLGSTSTEVAATAPCPVAVVRRAEPSAVTHARIVVGVDGSQLSEAAIGFALAEASRRGAVLEAISAWNRLEAIPPGMLAAGLADVGDSTEQVALALSESLSGWREKYPDVAVVQRVVVGHPGHVLAEASRTADLVVVGTRGLGTTKSLLLGSTSRAVLHHAVSPVVVVPAPER